MQIHILDKGVSSLCGDGAAVKPALHQQLCNTVTNNKAVASKVHHHYFLQP
jgi:murein endopeptidase